MRNEAAGLVASVPDNSVSQNPFHQLQTDIDSTGLVLWPGVYAQASGAWRLSNWLLGGSRMLLQKNKTKTKQKTPQEWEKGERKTRKKKKEETEEEDMDHNDGGDDNSNNY